MSMTINSIKVLSANCQGLRTYEKKLDVLSYMKDMGASIVCLQDTHLTENDTTNLARCIFTWNKIEFTRCSNFAK